MYKAVIAGYSRSPFTVAKKGGLIDVKPDVLLSEVIKNLILKSKVNLDLDTKSKVIPNNFTFVIQEETPEKEQITSRMHFSWVKVITVYVKKYDIKTL